jgi:hypothetical protein
MNTVLKMFIGVSLCGLVFTSCKKEEEDTFNADQLVAVDQNQADNEADDVGTLEDQAMEANVAVLKTGRMAVGDTVVPFDSGSCATVTITPKDGNATGKIVIDFKDGCMGKDGRMRKGKIISVFTDRLRKQDAVITTSYLNYGVTKRGSTEYVMFDNSSTKKTTTTSAPPQLTDNSVLGITREVNMTLMLPAGTTFSHAGTRNMEWNLGQLLNRWDNVYTTKAGSEQSGVDRKGRNYTLTVDKDVVRKTQCALLGIYKPVSGQITIKHENKTKVVDFGSGTCDNTVEVTINGKKTRTRW